MPNRKQGLQLGRAFMTKYNFFFIINEMKHLFKTPPNYYKYTEADETLGEILRHQFPSQEWWTGMIQTLL